jgi:D-aminoacyl-tRNA deacylase
LRLLIQRVKRARITIDGTQVAQIGRGICAFLGVARGDSESDCKYLAQKLLNLRIFPDGHREFDRSVTDTQGEILVVSQFTLCGDTRIGRRPSLSAAARPEDAEPLYTSFVTGLRQAGASVQAGRFQQHMEVALVNDGPVTFMIDSQ